MWPSRPVLPVRFVALSLALLLVSGAWAQAPAEPPAEKHSEASSSAPEKPPEPVPLTPEQRLGEIEKRIAHPANGAKAPGEGELALLRETRDALSRLISAQGLLAEQRTALANIKEKSTAFDAKGLETPPPYPLSVSEELRSQLAAAVQAEETIGVSLESLEKEVEQAGQQLEEASQRRRLAGEEANAEEADDSARHTLKLAELEEELAEWQLELAKARQAASAVEQEASVERRDLLERQIALAEANTRFDRRELEEELAAVRKQRAAIEAELQKAAKRHQGDEASLAEARQTANADPGLIARREALSRSSALTKEWLEARLTLSSRVEGLWRERFRLMNKEETPDEAELTEWKKEIDSTGRDLEGDQEVLEARLAENRNAILELEKKLEDWEAAWGAKENADAILKALKKREEAGNAYLADLQAALNLRERVAERIATLTKEASWDDRWSWAKRTARQLWNTEIWVTPSDRPLMVGHVASFLAKFLGVLLIPWVLLQSLQLAIARRMAARPQEGEEARSATPRLDLIARLVQGTKGFFLIPLAIYLAGQHLPLAAESLELLKNLVLVTLVAQAAIWGTEVLLHWVEITKQVYHADPAKISALGAFSFFGKVAIWATVLLFSLSNFGFDITTLVAGLGIGGVAVAFALQNILGDIFCSIAILLDEPFQVGDFIVVGEQRGVVDHIGIKTTRLRSLTGEQIVFPNTDLVGSRVHNYKRMQERRALFNFGVGYDTARDLLAQIPARVEHIIRGLPRTRFDRAHFTGFGASSLEFEVVYHVLSPDFNTYKDLQQEINLALLQHFRDEGIKFCGPAQAAAAAPAAGSGA